MPTKQQRDPMLDLPNKREVYVAMFNFTRSAAFEARVRQLFETFMAEREAVTDAPVDAQLADLAEEEAKNGE